MPLRRARSRAPAPAAVVTTDGSPYLEWQIRLLQLSHATTRQTCRLDVVERRVEVPGDDYPPYNRPAALAEWVAGTADDTSAIVLDPDMIFVRPLTARAKPGVVIAHDGGYPVPARHRQALRRYADDPPSLPIPIVPIVLTSDDLARLVDPWRRLTHELRADPATRSALGWLCEMWACALAVREAGLRCRLRRLAAVPPLPHPRGFALVHYAWATPCFDKRAYQPWDDIPPCRHPAHARMRALVAQLRAAGGGGASRAVEAAG